MKRLLLVILLSACASDVVAGVDQSEAGIEDRAPPTAAHENPIPALNPVDCSKWNTKRFFESAASRLIAACLAGGSDPNARDDRNRKTPLHYAAEVNQDVAVTRSLIASGADPHARDCKQRTPLHYAAESNHDPAVAEALMDARAKPNVRDHLGQAPLHLASEYNNAKVIRALIDARAKPDTRDEGHKTPLHYAARFNEDPAVIRALVHGRAKPNARDRNFEYLGSFRGHARDGRHILEDYYGDLGLTPLHYAATYNENAAVTRALIDAGANLEAPGHQGKKPIHYALRSPKGPVIRAISEPEPSVGTWVNILAQYGQSPLDDDMAFDENTAVALALIEAGADPNARDHGGSTSLHYAALQSAATTQALIAAGTDPNARDKHGQTPLHYAMLSEEYAGVIRALTEAGADPNARDDDGQAPIQYAIVGAEGASAVRAIIEAGADPDAQDEQRRAPLCEAASGSSESAVLVEALLANGANANVRCEDGWTPLHFAAASDNAAATRALIAAGAEPNTWTNDDGRTPLHLAIEKSVELTQALIAGGAAPDSQDYYGETPFLGAARSANTPAMLALTMAGADANQRDENGYSALHFVARDETREEFVGMLIVAGADVGARSDRGETPLHLSAGRDGFEDQISMMKALIVHGADLNAQDLAGNTPLHHAAVQGRHLDTSEPGAPITALLDAGSDPARRNSLGQTPWDLVSDKEELRQFGAFRRLEEAHFAAGIEQP